MNTPSSLSPMINSKCSFPRIVLCFVVQLGNNGKYIDTIYSRYAESNSVSIYFFKTSVNEKVLPLQQNILATLLAVDYENLL